jgi:DNA-binding NarL/FixJ family response regulator
MEQELLMDSSTDGAGEPEGTHGEAILVVDDDPFIARLLEIELKAAGYDVRVASDGERALELARERCPELVLADVMMPNMDGFELTRRLRLDSRTASVSVIMLTARGLSADKLEGFSVGADDYIVKPFDLGEFIARVRRTADRTAPARKANGSALTPRELEVLMLLANGQGQKKIAQALFITPKTVATHIQRILTKLDVHSRAEAVAYAHRNHLLGSS